MIDHAALRELAAGAALDDLEPDERHALERHLPTCASCRALSSDLDDVLGELALSVPPLEPPVDLRTSILTALREPARPTLALVGGTAAGTVSPAPTGALAAPPKGAVVSPSGTRRAARWAGLAAAAVFAIAAVGLGAQNQQLHDQVAASSLALADAQARLQARQAAVALVADAKHVSVALHAESVAPAAQAVVMYRPGSNDAVLMATGLPATPAGQVYQLWYADAAGVHALGTFAFDGNGPFVAPFGVDLRGSAAAMVTLEPAGGSTGEPGPQVVFGEL